MIRLGDKAGKLSRLAILALLALLAPLTCLCNFPSSTLERLSTPEQGEATEEDITDPLGYIAELEEALSIPEFDATRVEYEFDEGGSVERVEYPLEEDVLFGQVSADISLVYTPDEQGVSEELVYAFQDVGEIDSLWVELPKSFVESVDSVADFYGICDWSGLEITDVVIHETDPLIELIRMKIEETDAQLSLAGRILSIDLQNPGATEELAAAGEAQARQLRVMRAVRKELRSIEEYAASGTEVRIGHAGWDLLKVIVLVPDLFSDSDCEYLGVPPYLEMNELSEQHMKYVLCMAVTTRHDPASWGKKGWEWCDLLAEEEKQMVCKGNAYTAYARSHPICELLPSQEEIERCLLRAAVDSRYESACEGAYYKEWYPLYHTIEHPDLRKACIAGVRQDPAQCNAIADEAMKEQCCNLMQDPSARGQCLGTVEEYDYHNWFTDKNANDYCVDLQPGGTTLRLAEVVGNGLQCVYLLDGGGEVAIQILPLASDAFAQRGWDDRVDWFNDAKREGTFDDFVEARIVQSPPYEISLVQQGSGGIHDPTGNYFIEIITVHGNCDVSATEADVPGMGAAAARLAISRARELIDHLRGP